ncbi:cell division protein FtsB [Thorsellia kenyensis]|uniref:Cell division protein FtsB n=1 Tax=Thorsellia kenyensis TaxID=1549888 RepID=A0ABV6CAG6_9GAMM
MKIFTFILFSLLLLSQYNYWYGKNGLLEYKQLKADVEKQTQYAAVLKQRNQRMFAEIRDLTSGLGAIEERARSELNMIKPDETFYRVYQKNLQP